MHEKNQDLNGYQGNCIAVTHRTQIILQDNAITIYRL